MKTPTRDELKKIFKKVKHLRLPPMLEKINFEKLTYYSWIDEGDGTCFLLTEMDNAIVGIKGDVNKMPTKHIKHSCSICSKQRDFHEIMLVTCKPRRLPKKVEYQVIGIYMCVDYQECNKEIEDIERIKKYFSQILNT